MSLTKTLFFFIIIIFTTYSFVYPSTVDELGRSTVFLTKHIAVVEKTWDKVYEVWLKDRATKSFRQKFNSIVATGFLVERNGRIYLVTAAHVAKEMSKEGEIIWSAVSGEQKKYTFEFLQKNMPNSRWFFHPLADIAVHPFGLSEKSIHTVVPNKIFISSEEKISLGTKVCILGYPLGLGTKDTLSPILTQSSIASGITTIDDVSISPDLRFILLSSALAIGYSGAPVFISPEVQVVDKTIMVPGTRLIGVQSFVRSDQTGGKFSSVVPVFYLSEIFESNDFKLYEEELKKLGGKSNNNS